MSAGEEDRPGSVLRAFLAGPGGAGLCLIDLGPAALAYAHFAEAEFLVPTSFAEGVGQGTGGGWEAMMAAAWEAVEPMSRQGAGPALGAQLLVALGGNPQRTAADTRRHVRLALSALDAFRDRDLPRHEGRGYLELGRALVAFGRVQDAMTAYRHARRRLEQAGDDHGLRFVHVRLAVLMRQLGLHEQALLHAEAGQRIGERLPPPPHEGHDASRQTHFAGFLHNERVHALTRIGFVDEAEAALDVWRVQCRGGDGFDLLEATAELRIRQERTEEGLDAYLSAINAGTTDRGSPAAGRTPDRENSARLCGRAAGAALSLGRPDLAVGVFAAIASPRPVRAQEPSAPARTAGVLRRFGAEVSDLARQAAAAAAAADHALLTGCDDRARVLLDKRDTLLDEPGGRARDRAAVEYLARAVPRAVGAGELALCYVPDGEGRVIVLVVHGGTVRVRTLRPNAEEVARLAARARDECVRRTGTDSLDRLGAAVLEPVAAFLAGTTRVHVTAQGALEHFPFHAAPFRGMPLAASSEVRALPSPAFFRPSVQPPFAGAPFAGGPGTAERPFRRAAGEHPLRVVVAAVRRPRHDLRPAPSELPDLRAEAAPVSAALPTAEGLFDGDATARAVHRALGSTDVLHLAGHAVFEPGRPHTARVLLADRPLFAFEIACAPRVPRVVNLSGCRATAEPRTLGGGGQGLTAAFLAAGAETVIAPLWPVRDDAALAFNHALYRELALPGAEAGQAVRRAQLSLRTRPQFAHPGEWGAFGVLGTL